ncbi:TIM-barrel domain-containing protein [uncultured Pseudokineococcus sp.]|uniref:glycoside hydrolase family 31 protein n=1 Tax=uncultured Pseudokineococcus sp. TaxID=1642928 RepID=UPI00260E4AE6|nr:glycoside hydrolase family 31 protein [uncultured Pseudokineococcus sp.]
MSELPLVRPLPGSAPRADARAVVTGEHWRATLLDDGLLRLEWSDDGGFEDRASTFAVRREQPVPEHVVERRGEGVVVTTARMRLRYDGQPFSSHGLSVELRGRDAPGRWRYGDAPRDLGGTARTLDDVDGRTELESGVVSRTGVAVVDDSPSFLFDDDGWVATREPGRRDLYVFAYGRDGAEAVRALYAVSGPPSLLPRWALGNWWSRYHPYSDSSYLELVDRFRDEGLPFSVAVVDMDWHRVGSVPERFGSGWTGYSWEPELFGDPASFLASLHRRGLRATLNLHPADGVRAFEDAYPAVARAMGVDPETEEPIGFDPTDRTFLEAYFRELHHPLEAQGVDFWWIDWQQGGATDLPGVDPLWLLNHFHHLDASRGGGQLEHGMTFSRYAGPGSHRYAVGFSGDTVVTWASLDFQPEFTATAANIGYCWWSHDVGGHTRGVRDDELATRWLQLGVFSPVLRLHSANNPFIRKEPWEFPAEHREAMGAALRLRHRLVPYLHTMNHRAAAGTPLVRPVHHEHPRRDEAYSVPNECLFGSELLVAPITTPRDPSSRHGSVRAWLPPGTWTDLVTGSVYAGDRTLELHRPLGSVPVLLRAGGVLPLAGTPAAGGAVDEVAAPDGPALVDALDATRNPEALEVVVAPAASGSFALVEDAADGPAATAPAGTASDAPAGTATTALVWDRERAELRIGAVDGDAGAVPAERTWTATFLGRRPTAPVTVDGREVPVTSGRGRFSVTFRAAATSGAVVVLTGGPPRLGADRREQVREVLTAAQAGNPAKLAAWEVVSSDRSVAEQVAELDAVDLGPAVRAAVVELLATIEEADG